MSQDALHLATNISTNCFFNSLLKEWPHYQVEQIEKHKFISLKIGDDAFLKLRLLNYSSLGRHNFAGVYLFTSGLATDSITFEEALHKILQHLKNKLNCDTEQVRLFQHRTLLSRDTIFETLQRRGEFLRHLSSGDLTFKDTEQALFIGHNFHPTPKSRDQFDASDMLKYSPEFGGHFELEWFLADPRIVQQNHADSFAEKDWLKSLAEDDFSSTRPFAEPSVEMVFFPMHPWQKRVLLENPSIKNHIKNERLIPLGAADKTWYPTSSLRSIYRQEARFMLKFSLTLKLTNSVRHLLLNEVTRGLQLRDVLATPQGRRFLAEYPHFHIVTEPAYVCLQDQEGMPMKETIVVCRENPFHSHNSNQKIVLATLAQDDPWGEENLLQKMILQMKTPESLKQRCRVWFEKFLEVAVKPLLMAQANYGFLLGAHQQNIVLDLRDGLPRQAFFRDCQGTGYSRLGYANFSGQVKSIQPDNGNVLSETMANGLFSYYLIINSTFNVMTALSSKEWINENVLVDDLRTFLRHLLAQGVQDESCLKYLLESENLMHKGNFFCSFNGINENTSPDPLSIYTPIPNPLYEHDRQGNPYV